MQQGTDHYFTREFSMGDISPEEMRTAQPRPGIGKSLVQFYTHETRDIALSEARARYVPKMIDMVRIIIPGDRHNIVERRVRESDKYQYKGQYDAFKKQQEFVPDGTLLESWPMIGRAQLYELKAVGIFTVEAIATLSDEQLPSLGMGSRLLQKHAKAFLAASEKGRASSVLISENEALKNQVSLMTTQLGDLAKKLEVLMTKAGQATDSVVDPMVEVRQKMADSAGVGQANVVIPSDYKAKTFFELKKLCATFAETVVTNKADALELIEEFLGKKNALAA